MRSCRIAGIALTIAFCELSLAGHAALQSRANVLAALLFERIGATCNERCEENGDEEKRPGPHLLILGMKLAKANPSDLDTLSS